MKLIFAESEKLLSIVRELFTEYASSLNFSLCFQDFDKELAELPGKYSPPDGRLIIAMDKKRVAGCIALRKIDNNFCEMKRLYVRPEFRGKGIGKKLVKAIIKEAKKIGYCYIRLDTVPSMKKAIDLYSSMGFYEIDPYIDNPIEGTIYLELPLK